MERIIYKTPAELIINKLNYCDSLPGDTILTSAWEATDNTLTLNSPASSFNGLVTQLYLGGGTLNTQKTPAFLTNTVNSKYGRAPVQNSIRVVVQQYNFVGQNSNRLPDPMMAGQVVDYTFDWTKRLACNETIVTSVWSASSNNVDVNAAAAQISNSGLLTTVWMSGTVAGGYIITNTVTTSLGQIMEMSFLINLKEFVTITTT